MRASASIIRIASNLVKVNVIVKVEFACRRQKFLFFSVFSVYFCNEKMRAPASIISIANYEASK